MILNSDIVLGIAAVYSSHSEWIEWEMMTARDNRVPIVGVIPHGQERISKIISDVAIEVVRWNTESIIDAIRRNSR